MARASSLWRGATTDQSGRRDHRKPEMECERVFLSLGSNLGNRQAFLSAAIAELRKIPDLTVLGISSMYESPAMFMTDDTPPFLNAAVEIRTEMEPQALLDRLQEIEVRLGRQPGPRIRYENRVMDIDIMVWGERKIATPRLTIPHPGIHVRRFYLQPLSNLAPDLIPPGFEWTVSERAEQLADRQPLRQICPGNTRQSRKEGHTDNRSIAHARQVRDERGKTP
ncbi:MAG TPA: 2-amino-4-hydroxy-6-hydroxymethyldihydropteridine diphosphokinase [bacterium]|nr:2-amino-4-hydroxy-6-hydroxymethyldihydropteridine diphosphokinase [bacterium]HQL61924.1 2-amino-4-hydroxy-6-hydroxymethyldihydropteridine diphosphokinase [bacterium]